MLGWAAITQSTANCQLHCLECLHDKALCASHARYFASNYRRLTSSPPATKRTSWSNSSSTRQGTSREHQASPQCLEAALPLTPPPLTPGRCRTGRVPQSLLACCIWLGNRPTHTQWIQQNIGEQPRRPNSKQVGTGHHAITKHLATGT